MSLHSLVLPEPEFTTLLSELISTVVDAPLPAPQSTPAHTTTSGMLRTHARREAILTEATKLFAANGFAEVSTEDNGASVGISGPSVYNNFPPKSDILLAAMLRGDEWLRLDMNRAFAQASDPRDGLNRLLDSYCAFVLDNPHLLQVLVSESNQLPEPERHRIRAAQHAYIDDWVNLLRHVHPSWDVGDHHTAGNHQLLDVAQTQRETVIQPHRMPDDLDRIPVALVPRCNRHRPILAAPHKQQLDDALGTCSGEAQFTDR